MIVAAIIFVATTQQYSVQNSNLIQWLDNTFPSWLMGIVIIGGGALLTWIAVNLRHRLTRPPESETHEPDIDNDLTGVFVVIVTTMYAVLIAFMVFTVWTNYDRAAQAASEEGGALTALARHSLAYPQADQQEMQLAIQAYSQSVIRDEWSSMSNGESNPTTTQLFNHLVVVADSLPATSGSTDVSTELDNLSEARTTLLLSSGAALPSIFWLILLLGAVISIGLSILFFTETPSAHGLMAVAAAVLICTSLWLILEIDYPLSGDTAFRPDAFEQALHVISTLQNGQV